MGFHRNPTSEQNYLHEITIHTVNNLSPTYICHGVSPYYILGHIFPLPSIDYHQFESPYIINRPGVAMLLYKHFCHSLFHYFINWLSHPFVQNLHDTVYYKPEELGRWNFERMFNPTALCDICHASHITYHVSCVRCQLSYVRCLVTGDRCQSGKVNLGMVCF